ncbi:hypothetical protein [Nitrosomonas marina]|uniref:DUF2971 domain-containing protein n=1 Tax=Nitrosomonas marina TaxID=917 RepID=A0A1H8APR0_9PROT|nr:hypothetical protein [Nitrosomonas marina]SEM72712.1 hypothetical protein SAMN05216325_101274 [Nitrosomonas marina]
MILNLKPEDLDGKAILWRYMDVAKFISMLEQNAIWLARADTVFDKHEGRFPVEMQESINKAYQDFDDNDNSPVKDANDFQEYLIKNTFISCWHHNLQENMVMWEIYGKDKNAVAIQTTVDGIASNVNPSVLCGHSLIFKDVTYNNADEVSGVLKYEDCFFRKRRHFSFEQEVRISLDTYSRYKPAKRTPYGYKLPILLSGMIDKVVVHPDSLDWFFDVVTSVAKKYCLRAPVERGVCGNK